MGQIDITSKIYEIFRDGRVMSVSQRGWTVVVRVLADSATGPVRMAPIFALCRELDLDPESVTISEGGRGVVELQLDLDYQAPACEEAGAAGASLGC